MSAKNTGVMKRLAFIKHLYNLGVEQSRKVEPLCYVSILTFHDAVELFLQLVAEYLDVKKRIKEIHFMEYWDLINHRLKEKGKSELTQKMAMERLNKARVAFKHYGTPPSKSAIEDFRVNVTRFFEENTDIVFNIKFAEISLIELVTYKNVYDNLKVACQLLEENKIEDSLDKIALAFAQLIDGFEDRKRDEYGRSPFFFGGEFTFLSSFFMHVTGDLGRFVDKVREAIEALQRAVKILSLGLDYKKYTRFGLLTPTVMRTVNGKYHIVRVKRGQKGTAAKEDVQFCIDFVIESALILQEYDF